MESRFRRNTGVISPLVCKQKCLRKATATTKSTPETVTTANVVASGTAKATTRKPCNSRSRGAATWNKLQPHAA